MNKKFLSILLLPLLFSCSNGNSGGGSITPPDPVEEHYYSYYMYNYPRVKDTSDSGMPELIDNPMYLKEEIELNTPFDKPSVDPTRENYEFQGWFKEKSCDNEWNFSSDVASNNVYIYAKWGVSSEEEYVEPEYIVPETIITDADYRVTGILNAPIDNGEVYLFDSALLRLDAHKEDVRFAINYERRETVTLVSATYDTTTQKINVNFSSGEPFEVHVNLRNEPLSNSYYEQKAVNYGVNGVDIENYHIALGGSSSMENWKTSSEDMDPIVTFNHGIGGTTAEEWKDSLFERLIAPYSPKAVVYYVGVNDIINAGKSGTDTANDLVALFNKTHERLPNAQIFYVLINKLPNYLNQQANFNIANGAALSYANEHSYLTCIDAGKDLLKKDGNPSWAYFMSDGLHMSLYGYVIWGKAVRDAIIAWLG